MIIWGPHNIQSKALCEIEQSYLSTAQGRNAPSITADFLFGAAMWPFSEMTTDMSIWNAPEDQMDNWHDPGSMTNNYSRPEENCIAYAFGIAGQHIYPYREINGELRLQREIPKDFDQISGLRRIRQHEVNPEKSQVIAIVNDNETNLGIHMAAFHKGGAWTHKPCFHPITHLDAKGNVIGSDLTQAEMGTYGTVQGFYEVLPNSVIRAELSC